MYKCHINCSAHLNSINCVCYYLLALIDWVFRNIFCCIVTVMFVVVDAVVSGRNYNAPADKNPT